jgi:peptide deformylase
MHEDKLVTTATEKGTELLRRQSRPIDFKSHADVKLARETAEILVAWSKSNPCFGLSASMFGVPVQIIFLSRQDGKQILVNPKVLKMSGKTEWIESCYSFISGCFIVERPYETRVEYFDLDGKKYTETLTGLWSTVFGHEYVHFWGICAEDLTTKPQLSHKEKEAYRQKYPEPRIISKTGEFKYPL